MNRNKSFLFLSYHGMSLLLGSVILLLVFVCVSAGRCFASFLSFVRTTVSFQIGFFRRETWADLWTFRTLFIKIASCSLPFFFLLLHLLLVFFSFSSGLYSLYYIFLPFMLCSVDFYNLFPCFLMRAAHSFFFIFVHPNDCLIKWRLWHIRSLVGEIMDFSQSELWLINAKIFSLCRVAS